jgi:uncharacterized protein (TIGR02145 family)
MRSLFLLILFLTGSLLNAQTGSFTDTRDGQVYRTIDIGGKRWFRENLRFQTSTSFCPQFSKDPSDCKNGNYYSNSELNTICPAGWHVATIPEWESYISLVLKEKNINGGVMRYDSSDKLAKAYSINMPGAHLLNDTLLNLYPSGWVEGWKLKNEKTLHLWVVDTRTFDDKYHLHIAEFGFVKHSHDHHIIDKPAKVRKFPVRCVCELTNSQGTD